ncbi:MAG: hypothetical protein RIF34_00705 [Candidatus Kapaibacterium sp.]
MTLDEHTIEFTKSFRKKTDEELVASFNREVGVKGWVSIRGSYLEAMRIVLAERGIDISSVHDGTSTKLDKKVILKDKKLVRVDE